jgi:hypothetical protein
MILVGALLMMIGRHARSLTRRSMVSRLHHGGDPHVPGDVRLHRER